MLLTRKQFLNIAGPGALGAAAHSALGSSSRAEAEPGDGGGASSEADRETLLVQGQRGCVRRPDATSPYPDLLEVQGATVLPPSGGRGSAHVENYRYGQIEEGRYVQIVSFGAAHSEVFGGRRTIDEGGRVTQFETFATVTVTDSRSGIARRTGYTVGRILGPSDFGGGAGLGRDARSPPGEQDRGAADQRPGRGARACTTGSSPATYWDSLVEQAIRDSGRPSSTTKASL